MSKKLVIYYSTTGNTARVAKELANIVGGDLCEIKTPERYDDYSYRDLVNRAIIEISNGFLPELFPINVDLDAYDVIFLGSPNWCGTVSTPIASFLKSHDLSEKTLIPFCTHGGSGGQNVARDIIEKSGVSNSLKGIAIFTSGGAVCRDLLLAWLREIRMI